MSLVKLFAPPTSESARLSGEKSAQIRSVAVRHQVRRLQSSKSPARSLRFFENNQGDRLQCKSDHSSQARYELSAGTQASRFGADDDVVLATGLETKGKTFPPIQAATGNAPRRNSLSARAARCSDWRPYAQSCGFDRATVRSRESFCPAGAAPAREETNLRRNQHRRAKALCAQRSFPDRAAV